VSVRSFVLCDTPLLFSKRAIMITPRLISSKPLIALKGFALSALRIKNAGGAVTTISVSPALPVGLVLSVSEQAVTLSGTPMHVCARTQYTMTAVNEGGASTAILDLAVIEALTKDQRAAIIAQHAARRDLDTPRSQVAHAVSDATTLNTIKPHEKFKTQPAGDDKRLSQQTANNPDAEQRAQSAPALTPSPSAQLQAQAVARATPNMTPKPG
jgi:hypothetical protein